MASPNFSPVYAAVAAVINTLKLGSEEWPGANIIELLLHRLVQQVMFLMGFWGNMNEIFQHCTPGCVYHPEESNVRLQDRLCLTWFCKNAFAEDSACKSQHLGARGPYPWTTQKSGGLRVDLVLLPCHMHTQFNRPHLCEIWLSACESFPVNSQRAISGSVCRRHVEYTRIQPGQQARSTSCRWTMRNDLHNHMYHILLMILFVYTCHTTTQGLTVHAGLTYCNSQVKIVWMAAGEAVVQAQ